MMRGKWFQLTIMLILMLAIPSLLMAAPAGKVTQTEGNVDITRVDMTAAKTLLTGEPVEVGDTIRTKSKSKAEITFSDKNILRIAASSRITIQKYMVNGENTSGVMKLHRGMVQAISSVGFLRRLAASPDQNKLEVNTMNATCGIRGSNMIVSCHGGVTSVMFVTGHGYAYNPAKPDIVVRITGGNISFVEKKDTTPSQPRPISDAELDVKIKAVTPGEKSQSGLEQKQDMKAEVKDIKSSGKSGDMPGLGKAPTDVADLPSGITVTSPGQVKKALDLKTADQKIKTQAPKDASPGKTKGTQQARGSGESSGSNASSSGSNASSSGKSDVSSGKSDVSSGKSDVSSGKSSVSGGSSIGNYLIKKKEEKEKKNKGID